MRMEGQSEKAFSTPLTGPAEATLAGPFALVGIRLGLTVLGKEDARSGATSFLLRMANARSSASK